MAAKGVRQPYRSDQRNLVVSFWANPKGGTDYHVYWRSCLAGEESLREVTLLKGHWTAYMNEWASSPAAILWVARKLKELADAVQG